MFDNSTALIHNGTLWLLGLFSIATWLLILVKGVQQTRVKAANNRYKKAFWGAANLNAAVAVDEGDSPASRLAKVGFGALREADVANDLEHSGERQDVLERYLRQQLQRERHSLDSGLAILASIGSTAPFVGLFGTVWGIMHALHDIGQKGSASLDVVAGPIGDALIATGIGIAVAVPAVLAYNFFIRRLKLIGADLEDFATELVNLAQRSQFRLQKGSAVQNGASGKESGAVKGVSNNGEVFA
ncbi:MAG: MotA/TolQ/ExbB proton channel [Verrucomicrobiaceae bacterium]|nr:MotA/TolQ/ExbB proton channel [Verrucomicrobiaceae bacterium]